MSRNKENSGLTGINSKQQSSLNRIMNNHTMIASHKNKPALSKKKININTTMDNNQYQYNSMLASNLLSTYTNNNSKKKDIDPLYNYKTISNILKKGGKDCSNKAYSVQITMKNSHSRNSKMSGLNNQSKSKSYYNSI